MSPSTRTSTPPHRVRIAFFHIMAGNFTGAAKNIFRLLRRLDPVRMEPILVGQAENELTDRSRRIGVQVCIVPYPPALDVYGQQLLSFSIRKLLRALIGVWSYNRTLLAFFRKIRPEIIWADNIRTLLTLFVAGRLSGCRIIWNIWSEPEGRVAWIIHRLGLILADVINLEYAGQGPKLFGRLAQTRYFAAKAVVLYSGVTDFEDLSGTDVRRELGLSSADVLIFMAGNISPAKGQLDLLDAMQRLLPGFPKAHLLLAGRPLATHPSSVAYDARLRAYTAERGLGPNVHFLGWRSDIPDLLRAADIYATSSYSESLPDAVRDAMREGKPVVSTDAGGAPELIRHGEAGYLYRAGDVAALTEHLAHLIRDRKLRESLGAEGKRIIAERFSTELYARRFEEMAWAIARQ